MPQYAITHVVGYSNTSCGMHYLMSSNIHHSPKKPISQIEFTVAFGVLKIYFQDFACLYFHQFQTVCESAMKIDGIFTSYRHFRV